MTTLHNLARYYRNAGLVGEDRAALASFCAIAGDASVIWRGYSGTGKTVGADITAALVPEALLSKVDMISKLGIWSKGMVERLTASRIVYFPEDQNAGDNEEVVKVKKKWGDGKPAERAKSEDYGESTEITTLEPRVFISTAAITNEAHERTFDLESARRVVKVNTDPSEDATSRVLDSKADALVRGRQNVRTLGVLDERRVARVAAVALTQHHAAISSVRFFGAHELLSAIPKTFPESRSAFALFEKVLLGAARWYGPTEVLVGTEAFLAPQRVAEAWSFYGDILVENALKWDTSDREILSAFPAAVFSDDGVPKPEACLDIHAIMRKLKTFGLTDPSLVKRQITRLMHKGFVAEADGFRTIKWHRTGLADVANVVDWKAVIAACRKIAPEHLTGDTLEAYLKKCSEAEAPRAIQNPITGEWGPILGENSVLYVDHATGAYAPVGVKSAAKPRGILAFAKP